MRVGDYLRYTVARGEDVSDDPVWLEITEEPGERSVPVRYCCGGRWKEEYTSLREWNAMLNVDHTRNIKFTVVRKEDLPDEFYVQMAKQALLN